MGERGRGDRVMWKESLLTSIQSRFSSHFANILDSLGYPQNNMSKTNMSNGQIGLDWMGWIDIGIGGKYRAPCGVMHFCAIILQPALYFSHRPMKYRLPAISVFDNIQSSPDDPLSNYA